MSAAERANEASSAEQTNERSGASERASGGANGPVLYASISYTFYPLCIVSIFESNLEYDGDDEMQQPAVEEKRRPETIHLIWFFRIGKRNHAANVIQA